MISHPAFYRLSGIAMLAGGLLATVAVAFHPEDPFNPRNVPVHLTLYTGVMLVLLGLPGLGARIASKSPVLGLTGMVLLFLGLAYEDPLHSVIEFTVIPTLAANPATRPLLDGPPPRTLLLFQNLALAPLAIGLILLAIAIWRTSALPRWLAIPMLATIVLVPVSFAVPPLGPAGPGVLYLSLAAAGWTLGAFGKQARAVPSMANPEGRPING